LEKYRNTIEKLSYHAYLFFILLETVSFLALSESLYRL
jgi:hypothetical protein